MKKILGIATIILVLITLFWLETNTPGLLSSIELPPILEFASTVAENPWVSLPLFLVLGLTIGSIACPACSLPIISLAGYVMGAEPTAKKAFWAGLIFQSGRLLVFLPLAFLGALFNYVLPDEIGLLSRALAGILMMLFSMELFGLIDLSQHLSKAMLKRVKIPMVKVDHPIHMALWGMIIGFFCGIEQFLILATALLGAPNYIYAFLAIFLFGVGTTVTPLILIVLAGGSMELTQKYTQGNLTKYAKILGGLILLYLSVEYLLTVIFSLI